MAKRDTGVGSKNINKKGPHKTKKRLAIKSEMLTKKALKNHK
jgi:hypothetical protein